MGEGLMPSPPERPVRLREARDAAGLHIAALAAALTVPVRKLEALEAGRYEELACDPRDRLWPRQSTDEGLTPERRQRRTCATSARARCADAEHVCGPQRAGRNVVIARLSDSLLTRRRTSARSGWLSSSPDHRSAPARRAESLSIRPSNTVT